MNQFLSVIKEQCTPLPGSVPKKTHYKLPVKLKYQGLRVVDFLCAAVKRSEAQLWVDKINSQELLVNNQPVGMDYCVKGGDVVTHWSQLHTEPNVSINIALLYEDDEIIIVNKPAPLPMHPSGRFYLNSLSEILKKCFPNQDYKIVHRLDANTTGVVILAKTKDVIPLLVKQFEDKTIQKKYLALVEGISEKDYFVSNEIIGKDKILGGARAINDSGQEAYTEFKVISRDFHRKVTLLEVTPHTGRTNQIRLHLSNIGLPIVGDYGYQDINYFKNNPMTYADDCLFLHAWKISWIHQNKKMEIVAMPPEKFINFLK